MHGAGEIYFNQEKSYEASWRWWQGSQALMLSRVPNNNVGSINRGVRFRLSVDIDCKENLDSG